MKHIIILFLLVPSICGAWTLNFNCDGDGEPDGYILTIKHPSVLRSDIDCDGDTDGTDAFLFRKDFGDLKIPDDIPCCQRCVVVKNEDGSYTCEVIEQ
jgi:hypothetical protein